MLYVRTEMRYFRTCIQSNGSCSASWIGFVVILC